jgi:hypothetical protein
MMGIGLFPALFTLNFTWDDIFGTGLDQNGRPRNDANGANNEESREQ